MKTTYQFLTKAKYAYDLIRNYLRIRWKLFKKTKKENIHAPVVVFDLKDLRTYPYYYALIFAFHSCGYCVLIVNNIFFIASNRKSNTQIFDLRNVFLARRLSKSKKKKAYYFYDKFVERRPAFFKHWRKVFFIDLDVYSPKPLEEPFVVMPFPMAPHLYGSGQYNNIQTIRQKSRTIWVLFSGNLDSEAYRHPILLDFFGKMNRVEVVNTLKSGLSESEIEIITADSPPVVDNDGALSRKFVLYDWCWSSEVDRNLSIRIGNDLWLSQLANSFFFLCPPGIRMPLCFNCIEAMSVGSIPILEYAEHFTPPLEHLVNAIVFSGPDDLLDKVRLALCMKENDIRKLVDGVIEYYDNYLRPSALVNRLEKLEHSRSTLYVHATQASYDDYLANQKSGRGTKNSLSGDVQFGLTPRR